MSNTVCVFFLIFLFLENKEKKRGIYIYFNFNEMTVMQDVSVDFPLM